MSDRFGELRSVLQLPPSRGVWRRVCALAENWPEPQAFVETVAPYINAHLEVWPSALRVAPAPWLFRLLRGEEEPALAITRRLRVDVHPIAPEESTSPLGLAGLVRANFDTLCQAPTLAGLEILELHGCALEMSALAQMCEHEGWSSLEHVSVRGASFSGAGLGAWFGWLAQRPVRSLGLEDALTGEFDAAPLLRSPLAARLRSLNLGSVACELEVLGDLLRAEVCPELRRVDISNTEALAYSTLESPFLALAQMITLPRLERLGLSNLGLDNAGLVALMSASWFPKLRALDVSWNEIDGEGLVSLPSAPHLRRLWLHQNQLTLSELADLSRHPGLQGLEDLGVGVDAGAEAEGAWRDVGHGFRSLRALRVSDHPELAEREVQGALLDSPMAARLERLELRQETYTAPGDPAWGELVHGAMPRLRRLELAGFGMTGGDVRALVSGGVGGLRALGLWRNELRDQDIDWMCAEPALTGLDVLDVRANVITTRGHERLLSCEALERCDISWVNTHEVLSGWADV